MSMDKTNLIAIGAKYHLWPIVPIYEDRMPRLEEVMLAMFLTEATDDGLVTSDHAKTTAKSELAPKIKRKYRGKNEA